MTEETKTEETKTEETKTENLKGNEKKIILAAAILVALAVIFGVIYVNFAPKSVSGTKEISIEVVDDKAASKTYKTRTDAKYLRQALEEIEGLTIEGTESAYGLMVETVNGVTADYNTNGAYWSFYLNGEYCNYGIDQQPIEDGQAYRIVYTLAE